MMSGASGGSTGPSGAGTAYVGNYTGVVSPASGGFGLTAQQIGITQASSSSSTSTAASSATSTSTSSATSTSTAAKAAAKKATPNAAQQAAISVLEKLMPGLLWHNQLGEADQANAMLKWLGVSRYDNTLNQVSFLDGQLAKATKARNKAAQAAAEHLLSTFGVHVWNPETTAKGNAPKAAVVSKLESLMKGDITNNSMTAAGQVNALLTHLGVSRYTSELATIGHLDSLLSGFKKTKNKSGIASTEELLREYGVKKFAQGGTLWEPVVGFGTRSGGAYTFAEHGPETVTPGAGGGDMVKELRALRGQMDKLIQTTASVPHGVTSGIGSALGGAAQSASFARRYHT